MSKVHIALWKAFKYLVKTFWWVLVVDTIVIVALFVVFTYIWQPCPHWVQDNGCWKDWGLSP